MIPSPTNPAVISRHRILIVDDEEIVLVALRETLKLEGYEVVTALNAVQAMEALKREQFSVILTDHQMPMITGLEFLAQVKEIQPEATRILVTAVLSLNTVIEAINKGEIYRFIVKPWLREELLVTVKNAVQRYDLIRHNSLLQTETQAMNEQLKTLNQSLKQQMARVLERFNLALEQNLHRSVTLSLRIMETFYPLLGSQARRVHEISKAMADGLTLAADQRQVLEISAWLHDIGLVGVPRQIIKQWHETPESLNEAENALIHHHPILGQELARFEPPYHSVGDVIRAHHERFDGQGFPDGSAGDQIPWLSRLLAVAVYYAESRYVGANAVEDIKLSSGSAFDPEAVRIFLRVLPQALIPRKEREVLLAELKPGMVLAKGIYTANGLLLIPEGQTLSDAYIDKLHNHNRLNPISQSLLVYV
jgi:response regulator RpfG family c-di-GMP phosphodiesterase